VTQNVGRSLKPTAGIRAAQGRQQKSFGLVDFPLDQLKNPVSQRWRRSHQRAQILGRHPAASMARAFT
jgi:hypothetical protein